MLPLVLLFVLLPIVELALLIEIGDRFGTAPTLGLVVATGFVGAWLARRQGVGVLGRIQQELAAGQLPTESLVDAALILLAGALLVTPGVLSDAFGFLCLVPGFRRGLQSMLERRFERAVREGNVRVHFRSDARWDSRTPGGRHEEKVVHDLRDAREIGRREDSDSEDEPLSEGSRSPRRPTE